MELATRRTFETRFGAAAVMLWLKLFGLSYSQIIKSCKFLHQSPCLLSTFNASLSAETSSSTEKNLTELDFTKFVNDEQKLFK
ncbi:unnamed protein product [Strongylus vulgaris]|uniref:Uncharacterized protein n=1 Tax=Strongylus vulgaris TaxID=40348 RepID=A0A3P7LQP8_STRVU|nr:unnamed protein product [Strongylus vulgaris]